MNWKGKALDKLKDVELSKDRLTAQIQIVEVGISELFKDEEFHKLFKKELKRTLKGDNKDEHQTK